ncbi:hypothetical protein HMPREF3209_02533 [Lactobacillus crispatus]|nr:hypothetical protein HMPREF3209_02533 [Lactobacillus crispatus]
MMLQFLLIMPWIKAICNWVKHSYCRLAVAVIRSYLHQLSNFWALRWFKLELSS